MRRKQTLKRSLLKGNFWVSERRSIFNFQAEMHLADAHFDAALPDVAGDYMEEHWLARFAILALLAPRRV